MYYIIDCFKCVLKVNPRMMITENDFSIKKRKFLVKVTESIEKAHKNATK